MTPILKWAGGKRWLFKETNLPNIPKYNRLVEPFAGGAAAFFTLNPTAAWLNDLNEELISVYRAVAIDWRAVVRLLTDYQSKHSSDFYYKMRSCSPTSQSARAARFIYLNRTCFNGLYRVNLKGVFNVPIGTKSSVLLPDDDFEVASNLLKKAQLTSFDFEEVIEKTQSGDFVFADPPYTVKHNLNGFIKYNEKLFSWSDQVRLKDCLFRARDRGVHILLSNADHQSVRELYSGSNFMAGVERQSVMAASALRRKSTTELLVWI